jgi:hypothetical protein
MAIHVIKLLHSSHQAQTSSCADLVLLTHVVSPLLLLLLLLQANLKTTKEQKRLRSFPARKFAVKA